MKKSSFFFYVEALASRSQVGEKTDFGGVSRVFISCALDMLVTCRRGFNILQCSAGSAREKMLKPRVSIDGRFFFRVMPVSLCA